MNIVQWPRIDEDEAKMKWITAYNRMQAYYNMDQEL